MQSKNKNSTLQLVADVQREKVENIVLLAKQNSLYSYTGTAEQGGPRAKPPPQ